MASWDLFDLYRFLLAVLLTVYGTVRTVFFLAALRREAATGMLSHAVLRRYVLVLLLRVKLRRFLYELVVIGGLVGILIVLLGLHGW